MWGSWSLELWTWTYKLAQGSLISIQPTTQLISTGNKWSFHCCFFDYHVDLCEILPRVHSLLCASLHIQVCKSGNSSSNWNCLFSLFCIGTGGGGLCWQDCFIYPAWQLTVYVGQPWAKHVIWHFTYQGTMCLERKRLWHILSSSCSKKWPHAYTRVLNGQ